RPAPTTGGGAGSPARPDRDPAADRAGVRRRHDPARRTRSHPMKSIHLLTALALILSLAACNGESSQPAAESHAEEDAAHGTEADEHGHEAEDEVASTVIPAGIAEKSGIETQPAGPGVI